MTTSPVSLVQKSGPFVLKGYHGASFAQFVAAQSQGATAVVLVEDSKRAVELVDEISFFAPHQRVELMEAYDVKPYYGLSPHRRVRINHLKVLHGLLKNKIDVLVAPKTAFFRKFLPKDLFSKLNLTIQKSDLLDRDELVQRLVYWGYEKETVVEEPGQFAVRGDIVDIFSAQYDKPFRVSLFDIEVEWIKFFNPSTQRTDKSSIDEVQVIPARDVFVDLESLILEKPEQFEKQFAAISEFFEINWKRKLKKRADSKGILKEKRDHLVESIKNKINVHGIEFLIDLFYTQTSSLFDYLPKASLQFFDLDNQPVATLKAYQDSLQEPYEDLQRIETIVEPTDLTISDKELKEICAHSQTVFQDIEPTDFSGQRLDGQTDSNTLLKNQISSQVSKVHTLAPLASELNQKRLQGYTCVVVCQNEAQLSRMTDLLSRFDLPLKSLAGDELNDFLKASLKAKAQERLIVLCQGHLHQGFLSHSFKQWWVTDEEVFGKKTRRGTGSTSKSKSQVFSSFSEIEEGDYLIHMDHGIGVYRGLVKLDYDQNQNEFLLIEYLDKDKLYVPVDTLNRIQRFVGQEGMVPQLDKLGSTSWQKTKSKAKKAARKLAKELLELQAKRDSQVGFQFKDHSEMMEEFAASFEFEETVDQQRAIDDVKRDMEGTKPMDRLICGDVGYGKTEVAIRAAYKAICDHKQVAILVPTTVLAFQHFTTFYQRFKNYPIKVELISRFRTGKEAREVLQKLKEGEVDIVVGTHKLLSKDVKFRDLGLLVVDEEHRFGVTHKEKIKKLKNLVDVMTLTATPIPRTLNFALNGIRDLSIINTPPVDRLAVKTYSCYFDEETIHDAIQKEVKRGGQVYFLHNRVQNIDKITSKLQKILPEVRIRFAHGQMAEGELEKIMIEFMNHEFDVLVCTTIIESGVDIPNANTMIINRADNLGLAQLYQLRGRVGRSSRQAYCYLIVPEETLMTSKAKKRLAVIQRFTELGSGFKVASHDLEIRGAGNILGDEQSGHIGSIGYDMYVQLLKEAINEIKNTFIPEDFEPEIQMTLTSKIPESLIDDPHMRLVLYKQVSSAESFDELDDLYEEWQDRFGALPQEVLNLFQMIRVKVWAKKLLISVFKHTPNSLQITFHPDHKIDVSALIQTVQQNPKQFSLTRDGVFRVSGDFKEPVKSFKVIFDLMEQFKNLIT